MSFFVLLYCKLLSDPFLYHNQKSLFIMVCGKCNETCENPKETVKCVECSSEYHIKCSGTKADKRRKMTSQDIATWCCSACKQDNASVNSQPEVEDYNALTEVLKGIRSDMAKNSTETRENFVSLKSDVAKINTTLTTLEAKLLSLENENANVKSQCEELKKENSDLSKQLRILQNDLGELQQYTRSNNVEIKGIPVTPNEDVYKILTSVAAALEVDHNGGDVSIAHRLQQPRDQKQPPSIVVQFVQRCVRNQWLAAARKKHLQTTDVSKSFRPAGAVYVNEHLTPAKKALLGKSRYLVKWSKLHAAWIRNGAIYVKKTEESNTQRVHCLQEVCDIAGVTLTWTGEK